MFVFFIYFVMLLVKDFFKSKYLDAVSNVGDRVDQLLCVLFCFLEAEVLTGGQIALLNMTIT